VGTIYLHQLRDNLRSLRFQVSLVVLLLFFVLNGLIYTMKTERLAVEDQMIEQSNADRYNQAETVNAAVSNGFTILSPPTGTEFIAEAGFNWFPETLWLTARTGSNPSLDNVRTTNNWMRRFDVLDWTLIVRYVLSFLCVVLAYNAISGELETGTLRLVLANPMARAAFLIGKFLAHLTTLSVSVLLGSLISLAMLTLAGQLELDWDLWRSYLLFLLAATMLAALFLLLSMGVSALARNSATSLVFLVTAWTVLVVIVPQASYLIATQTASVSVSWDDMNRLRDEAYAAMQRDGAIPRSRELAATDGYAAEQRFIRRAREIDEQVSQIWVQMERERVGQFRAAMAVNLLSPGYAFQYTIEALLGSGIQKVENFRNNGLRYREHLRDFLRARDQADADSPHIDFLPEFMSQAALDPSLIPKLDRKPVPWSTRFDNAVMPMAVLVLETALALFLALWAINRSDLAARE
jgi:ABC-type transport system involved in multi-copper enzyme maturation permease subunit